MVAGFVVKLDLNTLMDDPVAIQLRLEFVSQVSHGPRVGRAADQPIM